MHNKKNRKNKATPWTGILLEPIEYKGVSFIDQGGEKSNQVMGDDLAGRLNALFEHFEIKQPAWSETEESWVKLVTNLALMLDIPGFRMKSPNYKDIGRPANAKAHDIKLYIDVIMAAKVNACSEKKAAESHIDKPSSTKYRRFKAVKKKLGEDGCREIEIIANLPISKSLIEAIDGDGNPILLDPNLRRFFCQSW